MRLKVVSFGQFFPDLIDYNFIKLKADIVSALTVAVIALPQSMAYALIAGVHPKYGLYSCILPVIISSILGSSRFLIAGPTNAISMVVSSTMASTVIAGTIANSLPEAQKIEIVFLLSFLVGLVQIFLGLIKFGSLVNFVSHSVVVGFTFGAGLLISVNQLKNLLGLKFAASPHFLDNLGNTFSHLRETNNWSLFLGVFSIFFILILKKISKKIPGALLVLIICGSLTAFLGLEKNGVKIIGTIPQTPPPFSHFSLDPENIRVLFPSALAIGILGIVEAFSISKSIASASGEKINGNRELIAQGSANALAAFSSSIPGSGSFTRSAVNFQSGAKTRLSGIGSGLFILFILLALAPFAKNIPIASLAGIIIVIAYSMVDKKAVALSWKATTADRVVFLTTLLSTLLLELEMAVYIGVLFSLALFLKKVSHPQVTKVIPKGPCRKLYECQNNEEGCPQLSVYQIDGPLFFGAMAELEDKLRDIHNGNERVIIIRMKGVEILDASGVHALEKFLEKIEEKKVKVIFTNIKPAVREVLLTSGVIRRVQKRIAVDTTAAIKMAFKRYIEKEKCRGCTRALYQECGE
jgi:SulP family sulfate permease